MFANFNLGIEKVLYNGRSGGNLAKSIKGPNSRWEIRYLKHTMALLKLLQ